MGLDFDFDFEAIRQKAQELGSDGCTGVRDHYLDCCYHHDIMWRTGRTICGTPVTRAESNTLFRRCIQSRSRLGRFSPMSWIRYAGVSVFGWLTRSSPTA